MKTNNLTCGRIDMDNELTVREAYTKPALEKLDNLKDVTFECPQWQCSVTVPPPPQP